MCRGIAARSGRGCAGVPAELLEWKFSGSVLAELSTGSIYLPHVCGLRDDVMRNLLTCASLLQKNVWLWKQNVEYVKVNRFTEQIKRSRKGVHW